MKITAVSPTITSLVLVLILALAGCGGGLGPTFLPDSGRSPLFLGQLGAEEWKSDLDYLLSTLITKHPNPFHAVDAAVFKTALFRPDPAGVDTESLRVFRTATVCSALALLGEGHTRVEIRGPGLILPFCAVCHDGDLYLDSVGAGYPDSPTPAVRALLGLKLHSVGGVLIGEALRRVQTFVGAETEGFARVNAAILMRRKDILVAAGLATARDVGLELVCESSGEGLVRAFVGFANPQTAMGPYSIASVDAFAERGISRPESLSRTGEAFWFKAVPAAKAIFFQYNACNGRAPAVRAFMDDLMRAGDGAKAEKLVLDLRFNGGGDSSIFTNLMLPRLRGSKYDAPGKLVVLIGPATYSSGVLAVQDLIQGTRAVFLGEPTGQGCATYGELYNFALPHSGLPIAVSTKFFDARIRGSEQCFHPSVPLRLDPELLYEEGRDSEYERALEY